MIGTFNYNLVSNGVVNNNIDNNKKLSKDQETKCPVLRNKYPERTERASSCEDQIVPTQRIKSHTQED